MGKLAIKAVIIATLLFVCAVHPAYAAPPEERWVVLAARQDQGEAVDLARIYARSVDGVRVARAKNGWFAILAGPIIARTIVEARAALTVRLYIPGDSYLGHMDGFSEVVFEAPLSPVRAVAQYRSGDPPAVTRFQALTVVLDSMRSTQGQLPVADIRPDGMPSYRTTISNLPLDLLTFTKSRIVQLDPTTTLPQVILTYYSGGAHCCTSTKVASRANTGKWSVVDGQELDADGYQFEDVDGDGFVELISFDNSFNYTFESYAGSFAPSHVFRFSEGVLREVTKESSIRPFLQRELRGMERSAKDHALWSSNGFLAGWVAAKAQVGEVDDAWQRMLTSYDRNPMFGPEVCTVSVSLDKCPSDKLRRLPFPEALRAHFIAHGYPVPIEVPSPPAPRVVETDRPIERISGTAFFITSGGNLLTNAHVVKDCRTIAAFHGEEELPAKLLALDAINDLAILSTTWKPESVASFRSGIRLGETVAVYGFPLSGLLSSGGNFTLGNVTALAGLRDDSRMLQISAPVQAGNSGGPLLDETGAVVGIVVSKLNAIMVAIATDDLAQNISFAIKASTARVFAEAQGINVDTAAPDGAILRPADLADKARSISAHLICVH